MKYFLIAFLLINSSVKSQEANYNDSTITLQLPRVFSWWVTKSIANNITRHNFRMIDVLQPYVSDKNKPDSLFTVSLPAKYVINAIELLLTRQAELAMRDYLKIVYNQKVASTGLAITGYTALQTQIIKKANGSTDEKQVAIFIRDWFIERTAKFATSYNEERDDVIELVKPD